MYDPTQVRLNVSRSPLPTATMTAPTDESGSVPQQEKRRSSFPITLLTFTPSVVAFAEAWEYDEDEDDMVEDKYADFAGDRRHTFHLEQECTRWRWEVKPCGGLEEGGHDVYWWEVFIGKEAEGDVKVWRDVPAPCVADQIVQFLMVAFTLWNDTVDNMDIGDEDGDSGGSRTTNPQVPRLRTQRSNRRSRRFRIMPLLGWRNCAEVWGGVWDERRQS
jgi:hypothetical protein